MPTELEMRDLMFASRDVIAGRYYPNRFLIAISADNPVVLADGDNVVFDWRKADLFAHEYTHYIHNIATPAGFYGFALAQHYLPAFGDTFLPHADGSSAGSSASTDFTALRLLSRLANGDIRPKLAPKNGPFRVVDTATTVEEVPYHNGIAQRHVFRVRFSDALGATSTMDVASAAIEESVAFLIESSVARSIQRAQPNAPYFPYHTLRAVMDFATHPNTLSDETVARIGTIALSCIDPAFALSAIVAVAREYDELDASVEQHLLRCVTSALLQPIQNSIDAVIQHDWPELIAMHADRGRSGRAVRFLGGISLNALRLRREDPCFDLSAYFPIFDVKRFEELLKVVPPCNLIQERHGLPDDVLRDILTSFPVPSEWRESASDVRVFHALMESLRAHTSDSGFARTIDLPEFKCPYYTVCDVEYRVRNTSRCSGSPWLHYEKDNKQKALCWFTAGATAAFATSKEPQPMIHR